MRRTAVAGILLASLSTVAFFSIGGRAAQQPASTQPASAATSRPVNTMCPIMSDNKIDPAVTFVYKGKVYGFCCSDCIADFKKDPEKYIAKLK
jgi:YHS domain-containing protein